MIDDRKDQKTLSELAEESGIPGRTIRFYISRNLLPGPNQAGRGAHYGPEHLAQLKKIKGLQEAGKTLVEISRLVGKGESHEPLVDPSAWWNYPIARDVVVMVRAGNSPWRLKQIQKALREFAAQLGPEEENEDASTN
jgi:DNA-binding transcriptional MerR regulator